MSSLLWCFSSFEKQPPHQTSSLDFRPSTVAQEPQAAVDHIPHAHLSCWVRSMVFSPNDSPLAGREGTHLTGSKIGERLLAVSPCSQLASSFLPAARPARHRGAK